MQTNFPVQPEQNEQDTLELMRKIKSAQTLITVATIAAPVSLLFGGVLLSSIALVCGWIGYRRLKSIPIRTQQEIEAIHVAGKSARMTLIMCVIALCLNAASMVMMYPVYLEMLESGEITTWTDMFNAFGSSSGDPSGALPDASGPSAVWG